MAVYQIALLSKETFLNYSRLILELISTWMVGTNKEKGYLLPTWVQKNWSLFAYSHFAYSRFAYFRPKSGVSPTHRKNYIWASKWCQTTSWSIGLSLKMYLGHVKVTSSAITGFVCTKSCSSWVYLPVEVCWHSRTWVIQNKQTATELFTSYTARSWSTFSKKPWKPLAEIGNLKMLWENYIREIYTKNVCTH